MKYKLLLFLGMCIILSSLALADANYTFTNATGTYYVNNYTTVGTTTWTVPSGYVANSLKILVVAGGGQGGEWMGGGGGAGGLIYNSTYYVTSGGTNNITVGNGGCNTTASTMSNGSPSVFGNITTIGGGAGGLGGGGSPRATNGGSGGGGGAGAITIAGNGTLNQGYAGGNASSSGNYPSGGGGGAGGVGDNFAASQSGDGGIGFTTSISGTSICYAGGGGGGILNVSGSVSRGTISCGGGLASIQKNGDGSVLVHGTNGTPNTGGGGGGGTMNLASRRSYCGGSGIVIIQYQLTENITTLIYPTNATRYTYDSLNTTDNYNGSIIVTSNLNVTCTLNDTRWTKTISNSTLNQTHTWNNNTFISYGNYSITTNCTAPNQAFWFYIDNNAPTITQTYPSPLNTTIQSSIIPFNLNVSVNDTFLYLTNLTITNGSGYVYYNNYSGIITTGVTSYNFTEILTNLTPGYYTLFIEATDSHTALEISSFEPIIKKQTLTPKISYLSPKEWGEIGFNIELLSSSLALDTIIDTKLTDRHSPEFLFTSAKIFDEKQEKPINTYTFKITSSEPLTYLPTSPYNGHFVSSKGMKGIWYDTEFEGIKNSQLLFTRIDDYNYLIEIQTTQTDLKFNSLGGLNYINQTSTFTINSPPSITSANITIDNINHITTCNYVNATDFDGDIISFYYKWYNRSILTSYTTATLSNSIFKYNETWNCSITPYDIYGNGTQKNSTSFTTNTTLLVNLYDLSTGFKLTTASTITFTTATLLYNYTFNGSNNITNLNNNIYSYKVDSSGYSSYVSSIDIGLNTSQTLNVYLSNSSYNTVFTIVEKGTTSIIIGASVKVEKYVGLVLVNVATLTSDITGKVLLYYLPSETYYFTINATGYITKTFTLNPIIFSTYDIMMDKTSTYADTSDFVKVSLSHDPKTFKNGLNSFTAVFTEPSGNFSMYNITVSYPNGVYTNSGTTGIGQTFTTNFNIVGATNQSTVNVTVVYQLIGGAIKTFKYQYHISAAQSGTFLDNKNNTYGMGILERVLVVTLFVILIGGMASYYGSPLVGGLIGILMFGYFAYIGFISWVLLLIPIFGFVIVASWRESR
jgi:hypothetical protein